MTILEFLHGLPEIILFSVSVSLLVITVTACLALIVKLTSDN
jgi:hypothetical protein